MPSSDPYYNRKPVPDDFLESVGDSGLSKQEEFLARERKLSSEHGDLRKFWNPKGKKGSLDPHYARKPVPDSMIHGVGESGLTPQEEFENRERKMFQNGVDLRRFSASADGGLAPQNDPYYGRKAVPKPVIAGVGDSGMSRAEEFETRENKAALFDLSGDPFQQLSGSGHRGSISAVAAVGAAEARRRSSAIAPHAAHATANVHGAQSEQRGVIDSTTINATPAENQYNYGPTSTTTTTTTTTTATTGNPTHNADNQHGLYHDIATNDPDSVAPDTRP